MGQIDAAQQIKEAWIGLEADEQRILQDRERPGPEPWVLSAATSADTPAADQLRQSLKPLFHVIAQMSHDLDCLADVCFAEIGAQR
jgi:hypothetical protein